jgi:hypothetical protein
MELYQACPEKQYDSNLFEYGHGSLLHTDGQKFMNKYIRNE